MKAALRWTLMSALFLSSASWAISSPPTKRVEMQLQFADAEEQVGDKHLTLIDSFVSDASRSCSWPDTASGLLEVILPLSSLPRNDYQAIGARMEALRRILRERHGIPKVDLEMKTRSWAAVMPKNGEVTLILTCNMSS